MYKTIPELHRDVQLAYDHIDLHIISADYLREAVIDNLIQTAMFSPDEGVKIAAQRAIWQLATASGIYSASLYELYAAIGRGETSGFTVPAMNVRTLTYDFAQIVFKLMMQHSVGAAIFEIARTEMQYTNQPPMDYSTAVIAGAIKAGYKGPVFIQGDHFQFSKKKFLANKDEEINAIKNLISKAITAHFYNIDIDASTLVDLEKEDLNDQQKNNYEITALFTNFIREIQPQDTIISIGGEIGHIGDRNSTVADFEAFMQGYLPLIHGEGIKKVSAQTGTSHGGTVMPDGSIAEVALDFTILRDISTVGQEKYKIGGSVQHGASTLPDALFDKFVAAKTLEIHLATGFQNIVFDTMPDYLKQEMYTWLNENCKEEWAEGWNQEQFWYKTRKKALGPFKEKLWNLPNEEKQPILEALEKKLAFLFEKLNMINTKATVEQYVK